MHLGSKNRLISFLLPSLSMKPAKEHTKPPTMGFIESIFYLIFLETHKAYVNEDTKIPMKVTDFI